MNKVLSILALFLIIFSSCSRDYYQLDTFKQESKNHQAIAILPVEMVFSGIMPADLDEEALLELQVVESKAFQNSLYNELYRRQANTKKGPHIEVQRIKKTNELIEAEMTLQEAWEKTPEELATLLGVDAVVKTRIEKRRYFSDMVSYGIDRLTKIISILTKDVRPVIGGQDIKKSNDIFADYKVVDGSSGVILWSLAFEEPANFNNPADQVIGDLNEKAAMQFPYKKKRKTRK